ncbi:MAG: UDP-N-acetylglucosamine 1-carboxyvinyltransferase [Candidatus Omnitrophota bacterium]|nr:UDP-N-acetylglucosamine 1-carboxyvinyltransferase [Candidatus Omnitrophota bacterium]
MEEIVIKGGQRLRGTVKVSGAKNSALPILAASLLSSETSVIENVPHLRDINTMVKILKSLGVKVHFDKNKIVVNPGYFKSYEAPYKLVSTMRASICVLGPLLARLGKARVSLPGGCVIGLRPIDLHLKGLAALGADIDIRHGYIIAKAKKLSGSDNIYLGGHFGSSVLATTNVMMAATLARGRTVIEDAACEPEVGDLANFLNKMGAKIKGAGSHMIIIEGVKSLKGARHTVIPDRIETGTYIIAAAITGGDIKIINTRLGFVNAVVDRLKQADVEISKLNNGIRVRVRGPLRPVDITTLPYPGFPTDMQAQAVALMSITNGISVITEKVFPTRFLHVSELNRMGSNIYLEGSSAIISGVKKLSGASVMASDLRASAALILAGLVAKGETVVSRIYHLDRGYEKIEAKLQALGAKIKRVKSK